MATVSMLLSARACMHNVNDKVVLRLKMVEGRHYFIGLDTKARNLYKVKN